MDSLRKSIMLLIKCSKIAGVKHNFKDKWSTREAKILSVQFVHFWCHVHYEKIKMDDDFNEF